MTNSRLRNPQGDWTTAILLAAGLMLARLVALFRTPLELYPDEAQYWLWSRTPDFGYYSKPPMVAWAIRQRAPQTALSVASRPQPTR